MMDETKREDVSLGRGDTDGAETLAEPMEVVLEGNNGEDIMVEVLGSDVFVDGVRSHDGDGDSVGEVGHGGPCESKPEAEIDRKLQESEVPEADLGVQSSEGGAVVGSEGQYTIRKEVGSLETDAQIRASETEEVLMAEDTQLLGGETQPVEEVEMVAETNDVNVSNNPVIEKCEKDFVEMGQGNDQQSIDKSVSTVEGETPETTIPGEETIQVKSLHGEDNLKSEDSVTLNNVVPEVSGEKGSVAENVSDEGEAKENVGSTSADSIKESPVVETDAAKGSPCLLVVTADAGAPDATLNSAEDQKANGGSTEDVPGLVTDAEAVEGKTLDSVRVTDSNFGREMEAEQQVVTDAEKATSDGSKVAAQEESLEVKSLTVDTRVAETLEKAVSDPSMGVPDGSNVNEALTVDMVYEKIEIDVEMAEAGEGVLQSSVEASEPVDNNQETVDGSRYVEDKEAVNNTEMADLQEVNEIETDEEKSLIKQAGAPKIGVQASYQLPPDKEGEFSILDLVWGKVRSHPWWPGQIFDPSDASEKAVKHQKKDFFLVAYFGDRTFAWNEAHLLKPFRTHFSVAEKQGSSEAFQNAVDCALEEVSRRAELGLACSCTPTEAIEKIEFQVVENAGIREESSKREGAGEYSKGACFEPGKLIEYMKQLAQFPCGGANRLELVIAKAQLLSFYRLKGYSLPEFVFIDAFSDDAENLHYDDEDRVSGEATGIDDQASGDEEEASSGPEGSKPQQHSSLKRKHNLRESTYPFKKGRSMTELMGSTTEEDRLKSISVAKVTAAVVPKPSFKVGECIKRIASQLTGSSIVKSKSEPEPSLNTEDAEKGAGVASEYSSMEDLLSQLQLAAQEPVQEHSFSNVIACFFSDFRNSVVPDQNPELGKLGGGGKRKRLAHLDGSSEAFEFDDMNDSYWTDRVIENGADEEPHSDEGGRRVENQLVPVDSEKPHKTGRRPYTKRRLQEAHHELPQQKPPGYIDANAPAELIMVFPEGYFPSEANLSRMFRRFGPIRESETEVDREASRARVVFKKCSDAEVACSSAGRFNIFGPIHVTYQLNYSVSEIFRSSPLAMMEVPEEDGV